jgi:hypothetical protein
MKNYAIAAVLLIAAGLVFAQATDPGLVNSLMYIEAFFCTIIPALMLVCFLLAAIIYAAGQMASSDQRARFHGWATSLLIGGITCGVMYVLAPWIVHTLFGMSTSWNMAVFLACGPI